MSRREDAGESVPLFAINDEDDGPVQPAAASRRDQDDGVYSLDTSTSRSDSSSTFPPLSSKTPKYLYESREHAFNADSNELDDVERLDDTEVPVLRGLLAEARGRGSIDSSVNNATEAPGRQRASSVESEDDGLVVGGGGTGTVLSSIANMANSILGAGIVGLPYAVREAGFFTGLLLLVVLGAVTDWTVRLMVINAKLTGQKSYSGIMEACFGPAGRTAVFFFQLSFAFGGMCAFAVILGDTIPHVLSALMPGLASTGFGSIVLSRQMVVVFTTMFFSYPLSLYRDIEKLSKASALALVSMAIIVLTVLVQGPALPPELRGNPAFRFTIIDSGFFEAVGVISFAYVCHHNTLLIYGSLRIPSLDNWNKVAHASTGLSVIASLIMAVAGYMVFIDRTMGNILNNLPSDNFWANLARLCFGLNMMTTTPLEAFVCREAIDSYFFLDQPFNQKRHVLMTTALVVSSMLISLMTCDLGLVLELTGGFGATTLAFIFPAACSLKLSSDPYSRNKWPSWVCVCFGVIVCVLATTLSLLKSGSKPHKVC